MPDKTNNNAELMTELERKYEKFRSEIPAKLAVTLVNFFKRNFDRGGFVDKPFKRWPDLQNPRDKGRSKLVKSGRLRRAIKKMQVSRNRVVVGVGSEIKYARIQNNGGNIPITPKMRRYFWAMYKQTGQEYYKSLALTKKSHLTIPGRKFIGDSEALMITADRMIQKELKAALEIKVEGMLEG